MSWPVLTSFAGYQRGWVRGDIVAGLTVWAVLIPESLAYATIAGLPPVVGLYAAVPALALYALFGSSRHLVVAPMSATAALSAGAVATVAAGGSDDYIALSAGLALAVGALALGAGFLKLGFLASFISGPVLKGFIIGLALTIMIGQLPKLFGVEKGGGNFFEQLWHLVTHLGDTSGITLAVGLASLVVLVVLKRWMPLVPGSLVVVGLGVLAVYVFDLAEHGVAVVGEIESGLPSLGIPDMTGNQFLELLGLAVGVMLVGFAEGLAASKEYAAKSGYHIDSDRELIGLGAANLGSGLCSGMVVNGSLSKTAVNGGAGAKSQLSTLTVSALTVVTLLFLTGLFEKLPEPTLAAVVIIAVIELIDLASLRRLYRVQTGRLARIYRYASRADFVAALAAMFGVLLFETLPGLIIGIFVSLVLLLARTSRPHVTQLRRLPGEGDNWVDARGRPELAGPDGVVVVRVEASLCFANADYVQDQIRALVDGTTTLVVVDGRTSPAIDVSAVDMLVQLKADLARQGVDLVLAQEVGQVRDVLRRASDHGEPAIFPTVDEVIRDHGEPTMHETDQADR
ncbi:SulP family inorganic anion transporter [Nocardioides sp. W7]|uniref:SulP family inorganic anion transporter n=1 Tax=Nocardioides sp. W7 TaxID=2931390 RepID=UPI001FD494B4|nr:SulP family inorganic anion transporter [Nocardioides sp. W7]